MFISKEVKELGQAIIETCNDWNGDQYWFYNKKLGFNIWTANGIYYLKMNGNNLWDIFEKIYIKRCINKAIALKLKNSINNK